MPNLLFQIPNTYHKYAFVIAMPDTNPQYPSTIPIPIGRLNPHARPKSPIPSPFTQSLLSILISNPWSQPPIPHTQYSIPNIPIPQYSSQIPIPKHQFLIRIPQYSIPYLCQWWYFWGEDSQSAVSGQYHSWSKWSVERETIGRRLGEIIKIFLRGCSLMLLKWGLDSPPPLSSQITFWPSPLPPPHWFIRWVGGEDQAHIRSYIEIHQPYPSNHANRCHNKTNLASWNFTWTKYLPSQTFIRKAPRCFEHLK